MQNKQTMEYIAYLIANMKNPLTRFIALAMLVEGVQ